MNLQEATIKALENKLIETKKVGNVIGDYITIDGGYTESQYESSVLCYILFNSLDRQLLKEIAEVVKYDTYKDIDELVTIINKKFGPVDVIYNSIWDKHNQIEVQFKY